MSLVTDLMRGTEGDRTEGTIALWEYCSDLIDSELMLVFDRLLHIALQ